ncbi:MULTISPECIES: ceramidase [Tenacibaculum]|uniref:Ceramidase n=1 Tax=Tenacibaculum aiptasiae TaxID=426481 RepID=A0A7J5AQX2_9FLAO|nr:MULTISPECIES: ceramidase [Tenacibaculum]KAB1160010.1 ceramidase [Tenacibaculum aiptasiae]MCF2874329.1 ceramidase [Tenacibaculum sp. Cn5-1]MCF2934910.1 ceramidase [Tenacibaculum sp. Cn5-34]MCG7511120.1 ceramidase [Tenacibaculum sp. Cn5-46]
MTILYCLLEQFPNDSGPIYQETIAGRMPVEPFNTFSNLIFLAIIYYLGKKIYESKKQHLFLLSCLPIIFISWVGGTVYHATRSHEFWIMLDWIPIMLLSLMGVVFFIFKVKKGWKSRLLIITSIIVLSILPRMLPIPEEYDSSVNYLITAISLVGPIFWYLYLTHWKHAKLMILACVIFLIAVFFRTLDNLAIILPMGTHWLWHTFGGISVFFLLYYIYKDEEGLA